MHFVHTLAAILFAATALLLLAAEIGRAHRISRYFALLAFTTVIAADVLMLSDIPDSGRFWGLGKYAQASQPPAQAKRRGGRAANGEAEHEEAEEEGTSYATGVGSAGTGVADEVADTVRAWFKPASVAAPSPTAPGRTFSDCPDCPEMVNIPAGEVSRAGAGATAAQLASLRIWPGYAIGRLEVTTAQFARFRAATGHEAPACSGAALETEGSDAAAATCLGWDDAVAYVAWLTAKTGHRYRLPSALEWHHAAAVGARMENGPRRMGSGAAELVADCWSEAALVTPVAVRATTGCERRTVLDAGVLAQDSEPRPAAPFGLKAASTLVGIRVVREMD